MHDAHLINITFWCQFLGGGRVSHREASSGCDISLEAEIWNLRENGGGENHSLLPGLLLLSVCRAAYWYLGSAAQWDVSDFDVVCVNILIRQQPR